LRKWKYAMSAAIMLVGALFAAGANGEEEKDPVFDPVVRGWQGVSVQRGFDRVKRTDSRVFHSLFSSVSGIKKEKLDILIHDFVGSAFELYASVGADFSLRKTGDGHWQANIARLKGDAEASLLRALVQKTEDFGASRLITYRLKSYDGLFPVWTANGTSRFVFQGVWNLPAVELPEKGAIEPLLSRALERMAAELGPEPGPTLLAGRMYLLEYRFLYVSKDRLGLFIKLAVEN
jgi:hypothetical protein